MKKLLLLNSVAMTFLAFTSFGQTRQTGIPQGAIANATIQQTAYEHYLTTQSTNNEKVIFFSQKAPCIDTLIYENFQSQTIPSGWLNLDLDGLTDANGRVGNWYTSADLQTTTPGDTNFVATSSSWFTPAGTANNVLILSAINPCANTIMKWSSAPYEGPAFMDGYKVKVSTTGTNITDFTTTLFTAAESVNGSATPSAGTVHTSYNGTNGVLQNWSINLGAYDNQTIYIAFFHDSNDDNLIMLDNIFIGTETPYDVSIVNTTTGPYFSTPLSQVVPRTFTSELTLAPNQSVTTPTASFEVFQGATSVFTNSASAATLAPGSNISLTSSGYSPIAIDTFTTVVTASAVEVDPFPLNNMDSLVFVVSDSVYATENGIINGALSIGTGTTGILGNQYNLIAADNLTSITFTLTAPTLGDTIVGVIYDMSGATPNQLVATTDTLIITSIAQAEYTLPIVGGFAALTAGNYVVGIKESFSGSATLATSTLFYVPDMAWVYFGGAWDNNESYGFLNTFHLRANFNSCIAPVASYSNVNSELNVDFTDLSTGPVTSWLWDFGDGNTSTMQNPSHSYAAAGTYTVCLIATDACSSDTICSAVTVTECLVPVADFTEMVTVGVATVAFTSTSVSASNATYSWNFGDGQTSNLENPSNVYAANGAYTVCLIVSDSCGTDTTCNNITITSLGIQENFIDGLSIYPIPSQSTLTIGNLIPGENVSMELLNNIGQLIEVINSNGVAEVQMDLSKVTEGYYHLRISNSSITGTRQVIIKR
jgi:PKD repeat protein